MLFDAVDLLRRRAIALRSEAERLRAVDERIGKYPQNWSVAERLCKRARDLEEAAEVLVRESSPDGEEDASSL